MISGEDLPGKSRPTEQGFSLPDIAQLSGFEQRDPASLRPALQRLREMQVHGFNPPRFRYIEALAHKAAGQRGPVSRMIEEKALRSLSDYMRDYRAARQQARSLATGLTSRYPDASEEVDRRLACGDFDGVQRLESRLARTVNGRPGLLAALTADMQRDNVSGGLAANPSFEDELRQRELAVLQSAGTFAQGAAAETGQGHIDTTGPVRRLQESVARRHSEQLVARAIREKPANPGPLNAQALVTRTLALMRDLSPGYASRFVSYMDTLLWLEQAGIAAVAAKSKGGGRRGS
jgi:hypothetical protein